MLNHHPLSIPRKQLAELIESAIDCHNAGRLVDAEEMYRRIIATVPDCAELHFTLGNVLAALSRLGDAAINYERALVLNPNFAEAHNNLGLVLMQKGDLNGASGCYERALAIKANYVEAHNNAGIALMEQGEFNSAVAHYKRAVELKPEYAEAHNNLGIVLMEQGELDQASACYERALELKRDYAEAHYNRAELTTVQRGDAIHNELESLSAGVDCLPEHRRPYIHFAMAKALDDIGDHARAFDQMLTGNALKRSQIDYDETQTLDVFCRICDVFQANLFDRLQGAGDPSSAPIFVLGMPHSGSTLIEQILASHPDVHGAGEMSHLHVIAHDEATSYPAFISALDANGVRRLGEAYLARLPEIPCGKTRITDKRPLNFLHVGLIRLILPNARIIHSTRNPVDTCLSCFSKLFTHEMQFTYNLEELGRYYRHYTELMAHWRSVLPPNAMLDVSYEHVVDDCEGQTRRLLDYCGLHWDDRCLDFHKTRRPVASASAVQVRQPLYRRSVDRWRRYEQSLRPLLNELDISSLPVSSGSPNTPPPPHFTISDLDVSSETGSIHQRGSLHPFA
jgi:tetratricopeptide (TPR) repeat protein